MPEGGTLSVTACPEGGNGTGRAVRVEIGDTGTGIDAAQMEKIWEPFYTTKERGSGLGLAIVRRIVESHGGTVTVQSDASRGTQFRVSLPRLATDPATVPGEMELSAKRSAAAGAAQG